MSKITFRADDALVERLDGLDASKSEVMREALREFLDRQPGVGGATGESGSAVAGEPVAKRVDELLQQRLGEEATRDVNVNITLDTPGNTTVEGGITDEPERTEDDDGSCPQCGHDIDEEHAYCPNCGEEVQRTPQCECGQEIRGEWTFCPGCGRRSPTSDVFDRA
ncbi:MAG: zinc-ribbon domain-containing protein [Halolamina sp.]|uniref:zinc-ribbon domain-containing protein n=1 Tax=Halolamina sp. TaxID=1940283 RepID=UPI002FC2DD3F